MNAFCLCSFVLCLPAFCGCSNQERLVLLSVLTQPHSTFFCSCWPASDNPSRCVKHDVGLDMSMLSNSDDVVTDALCFSIKLPANCFDMSESFFSQTSQLQLTALASILCVSVCEHLLTCLFLWLFSAVQLWVLNSQIPLVFPSE